MGNPSGNAKPPGSKPPTGGKLIDVTMFPIRFVGFGVCPHCDTNWNLFLGLNVFWEALFVSQIRWFHLGMGPNQTTRDRRFLSMFPFTKGPSWVPFLQLTWHLWRYLEDEFPFEGIPCQLPWQSGKEGTSFSLVGVTWICGLEVRAEVGIQNSKSGGQAPKKRKNKQPFQPPFPWFPGALLAAEHRPWAAALRALAGARLWRAQVDAAAKEATQGEGCACVGGGGV